MPKLSFHTEVFQLNEALLQKALAITKSAVLEDSKDIQENRRHYAEPAARRSPSVIQCDWWVGRRLGRACAHLYPAFDPRCRQLLHLASNHHQLRARATQARRCVSRLHRQPGAGCNAAGRGYLD
jgi:hypothetical protein